MKKLALAGAIALTAMAAAQANAAEAPSVSGKTYNLSGTATAEVVGTFKCNVGGKSKVKDGYKKKLEGGVTNLQVDFSGTDGAFTFTDNLIASQNPGADPHVTGQYQQFLNKKLNTTTKVGLIYDTRPDPVYVDTLSKLVVQDAEEQFGQFGVDFHLINQAEINEPEVTAKIVITKKKGVIVSNVLKITEKRTVTAQVQECNSGDVLKIKLVRKVQGPIAP